MTTTQLKCGPLKIHSVPVPRLYKAAKLVLQNYLDGKGSLKTLIYGSPFKNVRKLYAVVHNAVTKYDSINNVFDEIKIFDENPKFNFYLAVILASELVETGDELQGSSRPVLTINSYKHELLDKFSNSNSQHFQQDVLPTYVRVNTLKTSLVEVEEELNKLGYKQQKYESEVISYDEFLILIRALDKLTYIRDYHIPNLLVFGPSQEFWYTKLFKQSKIIVQDKASCIPAVVSGAYPGMSAIDACAAPGNKATHLASMMENKGTLLAVDKDKERFQNLQMMVRKRGATFIKTVNMDFTDFPPTDASIQLILIDPSCSSSGTNVHHEEVSNERVNKLATFQFQILNHALSFPKVKTVIYSTCSVNEEENEAVVERALCLHRDQFRLENLHTYLNGWKHFGSPSYKYGKFCLRTNSIDLCKGFFVAKFVRRLPILPSPILVNKRKEGDNYSNCLSKNRNATNPKRGLTCSSLGQVKKRKKRKTK